MIVLLQPTGAGIAFIYDRRVFFTEMLKKFSQEKEEEGRKQEYIVRNQGRNEDPRKY